MSACAPVSLRALAAACALAAAAQLLSAEQIPCSRDGLYADYSKNCQEYVRCTGGILKGRYTCAPDRAFSEVAGACVPRRRQPCIRRECAPGDQLAYATPGYACRQYYRCENGTAVDHSCPSGAWFDIDRQACTRGTGTCYEPLCTGLTDGEHPDVSHECRRMLLCRGGELQGVSSCPGGACTESCPPPRSAAIPLPAGDADFCSDEACSSLCQQAEDGAYADRATGCREYFVCESHRVIRRGVCEPGLLFSGTGCEPASRTECPAPARSPCFNRPDGLHRDWRDCSSWFECRRERVIARGACEPGLVFNGAACVPTNTFVCEGPEPTADCQGLPSGTYQDFESNCTRYFRCEGSLRTMMACETGKVFDGARCTSSDNYLCPSLDRDSCYGRPDGRYRGQDTGCRGYYACAAGSKAIYACRPGEVFDGESCVPMRPGLCPMEDHSCSKLDDGYHPEIKSGCHRYFYCEGGDRLATLSCLGGKIFDGHSCVEQSHHRCGEQSKSTIQVIADKRCERGGVFIQPGTECQRYYYCSAGLGTYLTCPRDQVFNGKVCVSKTQYTCPG